MAAFKGSAAVVKPGKILAFQANDPGSNPGGRTKRSCQNILNMKFHTLQLGETDITECFFQSYNQTIGVATSAR
jgi:hypothetical protein